MFTGPYFGPTWAQWLVTGPPDDAEEFEKLGEMNGLHLALAHFAWKGMLPGLSRVFQMLGLQFMQLQMTRATDSEHTRVEVPA